MWRRCTGSRDLRLRRTYCFSYWAILIAATTSKIFFGIRGSFKFSSPYQAGAWYDCYIDGLSVASCVLPVRFWCIVICVLYILTFISILWNCLIGAFLLSLRLCIAVDAWWRHGAVASHIHNAVRLTSESYHGSNTVFLVGTLMSVVGGVFIVFATMALCYRSVVVHKNFWLCLRLVIEQTSIR